MKEMVQPRSERMMAPLIFLLAFGFSLAGLNPTFYVDDSPETVTACATLGIPHPPGYPLHTLVGHLFSILSVGHVPFRVNLLSAVLGAALCAGTYLLLTRKFEARPLLAGPLALLWITGASAYPASLSAKTGIYELTGLFLLAILAALLSDKLPLAIFLYGLSFTNHWMSMVFFLPGFVVLAYGAWKAEQPSPEAVGSKGPGPPEVPLPIPAQEGTTEAPPIRPIPWSEHLPSGRMIVFFNLFCLGATVYLTLPLRAHLGPALSWGDPSSLKEFIYGFLRSQYTPGEGKGTAADWSGQFWTYLGVACKESPWLLPLTLVGILSSWRKGGTKSSGFFLTWGLLIGALCLYLNLPPGQYFLIGDYTLPAHLFLLVFAALGAGSLLSFLQARTQKDLSGAFALGLVLLLGLQGWDRSHRERQTGYTYVHDLCLNGFKAVPRGSLFFVKGDSLVFSSWYFQGVEGKRKDLAVVGVDGLPMDWVRKRLAKDHPQLHIPFTPDRLGAETAPALAQWILEKNPTVPLWLSYAVTPQVALKDVHTVPYGVCTKGSRVGEAPRLDEELASRVWSCLRLRGMRVPGLPVDARTERTVVNEYGFFRNLLGIQYEDLGDAQRAQRTPSSKASELLLASTYFQRSYDHFLWAQRWAPDLPEHPFNVGNALFNLGRVKDSLPWYEKAVDLKPDYLDAMFNAGVAAYQTGQFRRARVWFEKVLSLNPDHTQARRGLDYIIQEGLVVKEGQAHPH